MTPIPILIGNQIPLRLQLFDGAEDVKVTAVVFNRFNAQLGRLNLNHVHGGLYVATGPVMPVYPVFAQFFTDKPDVYAVATDFFEPVEEIIPEEPPIVGEVVESFDSPEFIEGEVIDDSQKA